MDDTTHGDPARGSDGDELARLRMRVTALEQLTGRIAHELATPLMTAGGFAGVLLERGDLPRDVRDGLERIERSIARAGRMLRSRVDEATAQGARPVRVRALVRDVVAVALGEHSDLGRDLPDDLRVFGEPASLRLAVTLLLELVLGHLRAHHGGAAELAVEAVALDDEVVAIRFTAGGPALPVDGVEGMERLHGLAGVLGGKVWPRDPTAGAEGLAVLLQLPAAGDGAVATGD